MREFISYQSKYDLHVGSRPLAALSVEQQDQLVRTMFDPEGDSQSFVMDHDLEKPQPEGLWTILVSVGCYLERQGRMTDFLQRTASDSEKIIQQLRGTKLARRLSEAFSPPNPNDRIHYDWAEIEKFGARDAIAEMTHDEVVEDLLGLLEPVSGQERRASDNVISPKPDRLAAVQKITYLSRPLAVQAYQLSSSPLTFILPNLFILGLIAFIPVGIFGGLWWGLSTLVAAIFARKMLTRVAVNWVIQQTHSDLERRALFLKWGVIELGA